MLDYIINPIRKFMEDSRSVGIVLLCCTVFSLLMSNLGGDVSASYLHYWQLSLPADFPIHFPHSLQAWINDGLMTLFFFLVGMEIKRELFDISAANFYKAVLPLTAAVGGMVLPACLFFLLNQHANFRNGWGIPMATDIAFSLGILSLLGKKIPVELKLFLTAFAIIDDLGAVVAIAVFYTAQVQVLYLIGAAAVLAMVYVLGRMQKLPLWLMLLLGCLVWYTIFCSGVHATVAGVLLAFVLPSGLLRKLELGLYYPVNYMVMPLFAIANTAIVFPTDWNGLFHSSLTWGVLIGLLVGKPLGIACATYLAIQTKWAVLPKQVSFRQIVGVGLLGGIGFTMSIFIVGLAFNDSLAQQQAIFAVLISSTIAGCLGYGYLKWGRG